MKHYRFIDYVTQGYVAVVGALILLFGRGVPWWQMLALGHVVCLLGVHMLLRAYAARPDSRPLDLLRHFYPLLLYVPFYRETGILNRIIVPQYLDRFFLALEQGIFGLQPSVAFMEQFPHLLVSELFYASYFSYYVMIVGVGLVLYFQHRGHFFHYVSIVSFVFYVCFLIYLVLPVVGPRLFYEEVEGFALQQQLAFYPLQYPEAVRAGPFFQLMGFIYARFEALGAAFPSSHAAVALCALYFSWRYIPRIRLVHMAVVFLLLLSTVYCRYHYSVDIFAGVATGIGLLLLGERLYRRLR